MGIKQHKKNRDPPSRLHYGIFGRTKGFKTLDMTSEGLWEMFEGDSADTCGRNFVAHPHGGPSGGSCVRRPGSEDPYRREQKFQLFSSCLLKTQLFLEFFKSPVVIFLLLVT